MSCLGFLFDGDGGFMFCRDMRSDVRWRKVLIEVRQPLIYQPFSCLS